MNDAAPRAWVLAALCAIAPSACATGELTLSAGPVVLGQARVRLRLDRRVLTLLRDDTAVLALDADAFQLGIAPAPLADRSWDPWTDDPTVTYRSPTRSSPVTTPSDREAEVLLDYGDGITAKLAIAMSSDARFMFSLVPLDAREGESRVVLARIRVRPIVSEGLFGLGDGDSIDVRGKVRAMQREVDNDVHVPVPLVLGTSGWGMFVPSARVGVFDVAKKDPAIIEATFAIGPIGVDPEAQPARVDLFAGDSVADLYREYFAASSPPRPPPEWAFGPLRIVKSNDQSAIEREMASIVDRDMPASAIVIDAPVGTAINTFDFDVARFPDPRSMIDRAHFAGLSVALWSTPYLEPSAESRVGEENVRRFFPIESAGRANEWSPPLDFTNPDASAFWRRLVRRYTTIGVDGFDLDHGEDVVPSNAGKRNVWRFSDASDERTMHHRYPGLYHRVYADAATGRDPTVAVNPLAELPLMVVRAARWGEQSLGVIVRSRRSDERAFVTTLALAASGFGYAIHERADVRALEQAALSPVMPLPDLGAFVDAALDIVRSYARLHTRLFPYLWTHAKRPLPIVRPLGLVAPELVSTDEYLLGEDILVAPIATGTRRKVVLPRGTWSNWFTGARVRGEIEVDAPIDELPIYLREGAIVPLLRPSIATLAFSTSRESFRRDAGPLWARVTPGPPRAFELWDGSRIERLPSGAFVVRDGATFRSGFVLELFDVPEPTQITRDEGVVARVSDVEAVPSGWAYQDRRLLIKLPPGSARVVVR